jgi:hypothetical protein
MEMRNNPTSSWWGRQSWLTKLFLVFIALVVLAILLSIPTYWSWG